MWEDEREIECPKHGSTFSLVTGEPQTLPATQPVPVYAVRVDGDDVIVTLVRERAEDLGPARDGGRAGDPARGRPRGALGRGARARWGRTARASRRCRTCSWAATTTRSPAARSPSTARSCSGCRRTSGRPRGLFLALQYPVELPGVRVDDFLDAALRGQGARPDDLRARVDAEAARLGVAQQFLDRGLNVEFSGGEQKRAETLQLAVLQPKFAVLDEIDSGLDVDALRDVARRVEAMTNDDGLGVLAITHYARLLDELRPDVVHVLMGGRIVKTRWPRAGRAARGDRLRGARRRARASRRRVEVAPESDPFADPLGFEPQL